MSTPLVAANINPTGFPEVYPSRIDEDIYDSLQGNLLFVFVPYGPSLNPQ